MQALKNDFKDFEDSIQYSSALTIKGLDAIITGEYKRLQKFKNCGYDTIGFPEYERKKRELVE